MHRKKTNKQTNKQEKPNKQQKQSKATQESLKDKNMFKHLTTSIVAFNLIDERPLVVAWLPLYSGVKWAAPDGFAAKECASFSCCTGHAKAQWVPAQLAKSRITCNDLHRRTVCSDPSPAVELVDGEYKPSQCHYLDIYSTDSARMEPSESSCRNL